MTIRLHLSRPMDVRDGASSLPDMATLCRLRSMVPGSQKYLNPTKHFYHLDMVKLSFNFYKDGDYINQVYKDASAADKQLAACWELTCKDRPEHGDFENELYFNQVN